MNNAIKIYHLITNLEKWTYAVYPEYKAPEYEARVFSEFMMEAGKKLRALIIADIDGFINKVNDIPKGKYTILGKDCINEINNKDGIVRYTDRLFGKGYEIDAFKHYAIKDFKLTKDDAIDIILLFLLAKDFDLYEIETDVVKKEEEKEEEDGQETKEDMQEPVD